MADDQIPAPGGQSAPDVTPEDNTPSTPMVTPDGGVVGVPTDNSGAAAALPDALTHQVKDVARATVSGAANAPHYLTESLDSGVTAFRQLLKDHGLSVPTVRYGDKGLEFSLEDQSAPETSSALVAPKIDAFKPDTALGHFAESTSQFITSMAAVGPFVRAAGLTGSAATIAKTGLANAFGFDSKDGLLADTLKNYPSVAQYVSPYLLSDPNDSEALARLKRGIEGLGLGAAGEAILGAVRTFKAVKSGSAADAEAAAADTQTALDKVNTPPEEGTQLSADTNPDVAKAAQLETASTVDSVDNSINMPRTNGDTIPLEDGPRFPVKEAPEAPVLSDVDIDAYKAKLARNDDWLKDGGVAPDSVNFNFGRFPTSDDVRNAITTLEDQVKATPGALDGVQPLAEVRRVADMIGADSGDMLAMMQKDATNSTTLGARIVAYGDFYASQASKVSKLASLVNERIPGDYGDINTLMSEFEKEVRILNEARVAYKTTSSNVARALGSHRIALKDGALGAAAGDDGAGLAGLSLDNIGGEENLLRIAKSITMADQNATAITRVIQPTLSGKIMQAANSMIVNNLLSLGTVTVKATTDAFRVLYDPVEKMISGVYQAVGQGAYGAIGGDGFMNGAAEGITRAKEGLAQYASYGRYLFDALESAGRSFKLGGQVTDAMQGHTIPEGFGDGTVINNLLEGNEGTAMVNGMVRYATLPTRVIGSLDDFVKNLRYRAEVYRKAARDTALDTTMSPEQRSEALADKVRQAFGPQGQAIDGEALNVAREATNTQAPIRDPQKLMLGATKSATAVAVDAANSIPAIRQVQPFIKVISNIQRYGWQRTPGLNLLQAEYRRDLLAGGERTADSMAKLTTGSMIMAAGAYMYNGGFITGTLHPDPAVQRQIEDQTGQRHNSFVINHPDGTKSYVPMNQVADPIGPMLSMAADFAASAHYMNDHDYMAFGTSIAAAVGNSLADKRYFEGITNAWQAFVGTLDPDLTKGERVQKFVGQWAAGYVPSMLSNRHDEDPYMREIRGVLDGMMRKTPGSVGVDPHRNVLGEPVSPAPSLGPRDLSPYQRSAEDTDPVNTELARQLSMGDKPIPRMPLKVGLPGQPNTVDLTKVQGPNGFSAYDHMQELMSQGVDGRPSLREALTEKMNSDAYAKASDNTGQYEGSRRYEIDKLIGAYQQGARAKLLEESKNSSDPQYASIFKQAVGDAQNRAAALRGTTLPAPALLKRDPFKQAITAAQ